MKNSWPLLHNLKSILVSMAFLLTFGFVQAQTIVPFPTETPPYNDLSPWGYDDSKLGWDASSYLPFIYQGTWFRLMPPNGVSYDAATNSWTYDDPTKEYPMMVYSMGAGGRGVDNSVQLKRKNDIGQRFANAVASDEFPGFVLFWQTELQYISADKIAAITQKLINELNIDKNRIYISGRSRGATMTWEFTRDRPDMWAASLSISGASGSFFSQNAIHVPVRLGQGGLDKNPTPDKAEDLVEQYENFGGNMEYFYYPTNGHSTWNPVYNRSDFYSWFLEQKKNNLHVYYGFTEVCPGDAVNIKMGFTAGFDGYEWRKDGVLIPGATGNDYTATAFGTYTARFRRGSEWTDWSDPVVIALKQPTVTPPIEVNGLKSPVLPSADGSTTVELMMPEGYESYIWKKVGSETVIGNARILEVSEPGEYIASVAEFGGCSSNYSDPFSVVDANGVNNPDLPTNLKGAALSQTSILLTWDQNPTPAFNETAFEILRSDVTGGPYTLVGITGQDASEFTDTGLEPNTVYYYLLRAVNDFSASAVTPELAVVSELDEQAPNAPKNLLVAGTTPTTISLNWDEATDNVGVFGYDVYVDGVKFGATTQTNYIINGLTNYQVYGFTVKARDESGNVSVASEQVMGIPVFNGLFYSYYEGDWTSLPDFDALVPLKSGYTPNINIGLRDEEDRFGFSFEGYIDIPETDDYTFYLKSDDGSRLYIDGEVVVNYDGTHGAGERNGVVNLAAGPHTFRVIYFDRTSGQRLEVRWKSTTIGKQLIPNSAFTDDVSLPAGPTAPSNIEAVATSYESIDVSWTLPDASAENVEIYRSVKGENNFNIIATVAANGLNYSDTGLLPSTTYEYMLRSIANSGVSAKVPASNARAHWNVNNNYVDESGEGQILTPRNGLTFSTDAKEGSHSLFFDGSNDYGLLANNGSSFFINEFDKRSVALWIKPSLTTGNRIIFDEGGSTNGISMRINNNVLQAAVRKGGGGSQATLSTPFTSTEWNHVAMVFDNGTFALYLNGVKVDENLNTGYPIVTRHTDKSEIGRTTGSNAFGSIGTYFSGLMDNIMVFDIALEEATILSIMAGGDNSATTLALPPAPAAPDGLVSPSQENTSITLQWNDNSLDEISFEIYRSVITNDNYTLQATVAASDLATGTFTDEGLFPHTNYFYKVLAKNVGGSSAMTSELAVASLNSLPALPSLSNLTVRFDENKNIPVLVTDADGDVLALNGTNLPSFVEFFDYGDGEGEIIISPTEAVQGTYLGLTLEANDGFGGIVSTSFDLVVNSNYSPVMGEVLAIDMKEGELNNAVFTASDLNGDPLSWSTENLPAFITESVNGGNLELAINPGLTDAGVYAIPLTVNDGNGGIDTKILTITVNDFDPNYLVYVNFGNASAAASPWNNAMTADGASGYSLGSLVNDDGIATDIAVTLESSWNGASTTGGKTPGIYPNAVMQSYLWLNGPTQQVRISGLNAGYLYNFSFLASRNSNGDRTTVFEINGNTASVDATQNTGNLAVINGITADSNGDVVLLVSNGPSASYSYMNAMVIESVYQDGSVPAVPENLQANLSAENDVELSWTDIAYNESGYRVLRSESGSGVETEVAALDANVVAYIDATALGHTDYEYRVEAFNDFGTAYSEIALITTLNNAPAFVGLTNTSMVQGSPVQVDLIANDADGDGVVLEIVSAPAFATYLAGAPESGTGTLTFNPSATELGAYSIMVKASDLDSEGAVIGSTTESFTMTVTSTEVIATFVNFNNGANQAAPWNNFNASPSAGVSLSGLLDEDGVNTGYGIQLVEAWKGDNNLGVVTGDDSGVYPDNVMMTSFWESTNASRTMNITGLAPDKLYDLDFFSSRAGDGDRTTIFTINGVERSINAAFNASNTASFTGLSTADGTITVSIRRAASATYFYLNAMVIKSYDDDGLPNKPSGLVSDVTSQSTINLSWNDDASNETGYEVWRSDNDNSNFTLIASLGANANSYEDTGLTANTTYFYKVRAENSGVGYSQFSEESSASTFEYSVSVNLNDLNGAPSPWNNIATYMVTDDVVYNLKDDQGSITNISMTMVQEFQGDNPFGVNTGDNSGIVPDAVMEGSYWLDPGQFAIIRLSGLSFVHSYNISFFASRDGGGDRNTDFTINGQTVKLNASYNTSNMVQLKDITADVNGNVEIRIATSEGSNFGYLNGFIVQASRLPEGEGTRVAQAQSDRGSVSVESLSIYPNPFESDLTVQIKDFKADESLKFELYNSTGALIHTENVELNTLNTNNVQLNFERYNLNEGIYMLNIVNRLGENKVYRIIKR